MKNIVVALGIVAATAASAHAGGIEFGQNRVYNDQVNYHGGSHEGAGIDCGSQRCVDTEHVQGEITTHHTTTEGAQRRVEQVVKRTVITPIDRTVVDTIERVVVVPVHETYYAPARAETIAGRTIQEVSWAPMEQRNMPWKAGVDMQTCFCSYPTATNNLDLY